MPVLSPEERLHLRQLRGMVPPVAWGLIERLMKATGDWMEGWG